MIDNGKRSLDLKCFHRLTSHNTIYEQIKIKMSGENSSMVQFKNIKFAISTIELGFIGYHASFLIYNRESQHLLRE